MMMQSKWNISLVVTAFIGGVSILYFLERSRRRSLQNSDSQELSSAQNCNSKKQSPPLPFVKKLKNGPLPKAIIPEFENSAIRSWRLAYRRYRLGGEHGAEGEADDLLRLNDNSMQMDQPQSNSGDIEDGSSKQVKFEEGSWDEIEHTQKLITEYRLGYRRHRMGSSTGAKGELADLLSKMNKKSLRFLPAAQVATLRRAQVTGLPRKASMVSLQDPRFHVHFGGGKLGLGLIIPAIVKSQVKFAVVQRSSKDFESLVQGVNLQDKKDSSDKIKSIALKVNEDEIAQVGLVTCLSDIPVDWLEWLKMRRSDDGLPPPSNLAPVGLFVLSEDPDVLDLLVGGASSFSTSLGPGLGKLPLILSDKRLPPKSPNPRGNRPALFAGENDHAAIAQLAERLEGRVDVVPCMVDRICIGRKISEKSIEVETEPYHGSIVVLSPPPHVSTPPFSGEHVLVPRVSSEADYLCSRKLLMVNGSHTTLAFLTLVTELTNPPYLIGDKLPPPECDMGLMKIASAKAEHQSLIWAWAVARILVLLFEWDLEVIKSAHGLEEGVESNEQVVDVLVTYAQETLTRFDSMEGDTVGRVLGGGVRNRYRGRLLPVKTFLDDMAAQLKLQQQQQLKQRISSLQIGKKIEQKSAKPPPAVGVVSGEAPPLPLSRTKRTLASLVMDRCGLDLGTLTQEVTALVALATPFTGQDAPENSNNQITSK